METTLPYIGLLARYPSVVSAILAFFYVFLVRGVEVSKACHWPVQEMVQVTLSLTGSLNVCSRAGTLPAAGAAKRDLNSCSWNFPAVCINMAYTCKSMADHLVANLHILAFQHILPSKWMPTHPDWPCTSPYHATFTYKHTEMLS